MGELRVFGIRHHGPGSAHSLAAALDSYVPDVVLIEGPPDATELLKWVPQLVPPVALFAYDPTEPNLATFWPFAVFSPEWQALTWAAGHQVPAQFIDLPAQIMLAQRQEERARRLATLESEGEIADEPSPAPEPPSPDEDPPSPDEDPGRPSCCTTRPGSSAGDGNSAVPGLDPGRPQPDMEEPLSEEDRDDSPDSISSDPFALLAELAGIADPERWWDEVVESVPPGDRFPAVTEMMAQLRAAQAEDFSPGGEFAGSTSAVPGLGAGAARPQPNGDTSPGTVRRFAIDPQDLVREAWMRNELRQAVKRYQRVAVVCGAYHAPALNEPWPTAKADTELVKGLPKQKTELAWVPWTHSRLAAASGYGAGVASPGWYHHLFTTTDRPIIRWLAKTAATLRAHDLPVSSAHIIEATRLAEALAGMRGRGLPGLGEVTEATRAVFCDGDEVLLAFVNRELVIGEELGQVPAEAPLVPLEADLRATAKRLRLPFSAVDKEYTLDLRKDNERARSALLHRLAILGINWGIPRQENSTGTFKEAWTLCWQPEFAVSIVEAATWGTSLPLAAAAKLAAQAQTLAQVGQAIELALVADLNEVLNPLLTTLDARAAATSDVEQLLGSVPPLARSARYGTVRGTDTEALRAVAESVLVRACAGLGPAVAGLDEEAARRLAVLFGDTQRAVSLLSDDANADWVSALLEVTNRPDAPPLLAGRATRLLFDQDKLASDDVTGRLSRALSAGWPPADQAGWVEGLLAGDALLLIHDRALLSVLDQWVTELTDEAFTDVLPMVRRTFGGYSRTERRYLEAEALGVGRQTGGGGPELELDLVVAEPVLATVRLLLGIGGSG